MYEVNMKYLDESNLNNFNFRCEKFNIDNNGYKFEKIKIDDFEIIDLEINNEDIASITIK